MVVKKDVPVIFGKIGFFNQNKIAHTAVHVFIGFAFAHLAIWVHWIWLSFIFLILVGFKEFFVDAKLYEHKIDSQVFDALQYFLGFIMYFVWAFLVEMFPGQIVI